MSSSSDSDITDDNPFEPRDYQLRLLDHALKSNVLIYLPTGSGKTFIAIMALKEMAKDLIGSFKEGAKRSIFLCNTVALTHQQGEAFRKSLNLKVSVYTGQQNVDSWKRDKWSVEFENCQVIIATCQIIVDCIRHGFLPISQINLIIVDECHHASGGHPMVQLMKLFQEEHPSRLPRVIGLTGTLLKATSINTILPTLEKLEAVFRAKIITVENMNEYKNVLIYSTKPKEIIIKYHHTTISSPLMDRVKSLIAECIEMISKWNVDESHYRYSKNLQSLRAPNPIKFITNLLNDFVYQMEDMGLYMASIAIMSVIVELEVKKRASETSVYRKLIRCVLTYAEFIRHILVQSIYDEDDPDQTEADAILQSSNPKLNTFLSYLENEFTGKKVEDIKCLVFVQRRHTAKCLFHVIKRFVNSKQTIPIKPDFMVGHNNELPDSIESILEHKWSRKVLDDFRRDECNLIVASSVLEEGIDIQSCNYVIVFDTLKTFSSYVQTKGRARMNLSTYAILVSDVKISELTIQISNYKQMGELLKHYLIGKAIDRKIPTKEQTDREFHDIITPFITPVGARLEADSALALLNRYCMSLPNDSFTAVAPKWTKVPKKDTDLYTMVTVKLPMQSTIKFPISSQPMRSPRNAMKSAAFRACQLLYEAGELNDNLLPITDKKCVEMISPNFFSHWEPFKTDLPNKAGTNKNRRLYNLEYPKELISAMPVPNGACYIYSISLEPKFATTDANKHITDMLATSSHYAILTSKPLPKLAAMPLFMTQGQVLARIAWDPVPGSIPTENHLRILRNFHTMVFRDIVGISKSFLAQDYSNGEHSFLIAPMKNAQEIDWETARQFQNMSELCEAPETQRARKVYKPEDYLGKIIAQWYVMSDSVRFVVTKVFTDLTPNSPFPTSDFTSFAHYFQSKYDLNVRQPNQFLVQAEPITDRRNFLRNANSLEGGRKQKPRNMEIILIPEFCHNFEFSGDLWLKALFLPSILHRVHFILLAEDIRMSLNAFLNVPSINYQPEPLIVDNSLRRVGCAFKTDSAPVMLPGLATTSEPMVVNEKYRLLNDSNFVPWKAYKSPVDITHQLESLHLCEIDYYQNFVERRIKDVENLYKNGTDDISATLSSIWNPQQAEPAALMDVSNDERSEIRIFNMASSKSPEQRDFIAALTSAGANDVFDMERIEVLGDSFLKFSISLYLLQKYPSWNEGNLTAVKCKFISNRNLLYLAIAKRLPGKLSSVEFNARGEWCPPLMSIPSDVMEKLGRTGSCRLLYNLDLDEEEVMAGSCKPNTLTEFVQKVQNDIADPLDSDLHAFLKQKVLSDKIAADSVEAILGVCVQNYGIKKTLRVLEYFGIVPAGENIENLLNIDLGNPRLKANTTDREIDELLVNHQLLEQGLGYTFKDRAYLLQALTHPSFPTNHVTGCYQQLEFVGDAILDFFVTCYIFERCQHMDPGRLTDLRSALVNNVTLACVTVRRKFHLHILAHNVPLQQSILRFANFQEDEKHKVNHQVRLFRSESEANNMAEFIDVPKTLGDVLESLIGAVFLDSNNNIDITWKVIYHLLSQEIHEFIANVPIQVVRQLYESKADPVFSDPVVDEDIVMVKCTFNVRNQKHVAVGFGKNKEQAKTSAAKGALQMILQR